MGGLSAARAGVLGAVQGPTELLPVSSSAHLALIPWFAGWDWEEIDAETRKSFEIALHAGTAAALVIGQRHVIARELADFDAARGVFIALSFAPPAIVGYTLERQIETRLGGPRSIAAGLAAGAVLMLLESACLPVPSEAIMLFAGFNVAEGEMSLLGIVIAGVLGNVVGSWIAWAVGYYGRMELLEKNRLIHINHKHLELADRWFERHGDATVFFTRMLPIIRTFISLPAGVARMPILRFSLLTLAGCVPWVLMLGYIGVVSGERWEEWKDSLHYGDYVVLAGIVALIAW